MEVTPLACESLGVRASCVEVETDDATVLMDPGASLGPRRFDLPPHREEYRALKTLSNRVLAESRDADALTISHYHFDHYIPSFENYRYNWSSEERARELFRGKEVYAKHRERDINHSQRKRSYYVEELCGDLGVPLTYADGETAEVGDLRLRFSPAAPHGPEGTKLGYVLMTAVTDGDSTFVHTGDVQGPVAADSTDWILDRDPDLVFLGGPPTYLSRDTFTEESRERARRNMERLARETDLAVDHHLLRARNYETYLEPVREAAEETGNTVRTGAELRGEENRLLEARRDELHAEDPVDDAFYDRIENGYYLDHDI